MMTRTAAVLLPGLLAALTLAAPARAAPPAAMTKAGCLVCHAEDRPVLGPSFKDIAARYKGKDVSALLAQRVRAGSKGVDSNVPMPATPADKLGDADLAAAIEYIRKR